MAFTVTAQEQRLIEALRDCIAGGGAARESHPLADAGIDLGAAPEDTQPKKGRGKAKEAPAAPPELDLGGGGGIDDLLASINTPAPTGPTLDDVRAELKKLVVKATGKAVAKQLFDHWKIATIDDIPADKRAKFIEHTAAINAKVK